MSREPLVTVLMSAYNDRRYLPEAVDSVLRQSFEDFELLVLDDGSTDGSADYLATVADPRVRVARNERNLGLTRSLNRGLDLAAGLYVARMDADDVAAPRRLARQVEFLDRHPHVGIVGSARRLIDESGEPIAHAPAAVDDVAVRWKCLLGNPFGHPTVMFRLHLLNAHKMRYDERYRTAQDYDLWSRLLAVTRGHNLPEPLLHYRLRRAGVSATHKPEQLENHDRIACASIRRLVPGFEITPHEVRELRGRFGGHSVREPEMDPAEPKWVRRYLELLGAFVDRYGPSPQTSELAGRLRETELEPA